MYFLKDDTDMDAIFTDKDNNWLLKTEQRAEILFLNTRLMVTEGIKF